MARHRGDRHVGAIIVMIGRGSRRLVTSALLVLTAAARAGAQQPSPGAVPLNGACERDASVGSAVERTLSIAASLDSSFSRDSLGVGNARCTRPYRLPVL